MKKLLNRITFNKEILCGKPVIRGMRISVEMILELLSVGMSENEIIQEYPDLENKDIRAALLYAHSILAGEEIFTRNAA